MADKEATVFILDLGSSMGATNNGRSESDLDWSMRFVWDKIGDIVAASRKTLCIGVVGLRTNETENPFKDDSGYQNISVLRPIGPMTLSDLKTLQPRIRPSSAIDGDAISAIVVAVDLIDKFTKQNKWVRKIYLITDGKGPLDPDDLDAIAKKIDSSKIELTVLGVDFDDAEYGFKEEDKPEIKSESEAALKTLTDKCKDGTFASMVEAIEDTQIPRVRSYSPYPAYRGWLTLGDPQKSPAAVNILVDRYFKTKLARPMAASTVVVKTEEGKPSQPFEGEAMDGVEYSAVRQARNYRVNDPEAPGGKRDVEFDRLARGYEYGRTAVYISPSEHNITRIEGLKQSFKIVGFISKDTFEPFLNMGEVCATIANRTDATSELAFASLVWALGETDCYAVARLVAKDDKDPQLVVLIPELHPEPTLFDMPLPFAEDLRNYQFPALDRVVTVSGQTVTQHRLLPTDELNQAMSDYVDAMDLSTYDVNDEGEPAEYAPIHEVYNPALHRINHAVKYRALHPDAPLPDIPPILLNFASPPEDLVAKVQTRIDTLIQAADVKKVPPKIKGKRQREAAKPLSGLDVDALLSETPLDRISPENAIPDFKRALNSTEDVGEIESATQQMGEIAKSLITDSFGDKHYDRVLEILGVMREELIDLEEPGLYNAFVRGLKKSLFAEELGGDRRDLWFKLRGSKLGLIDKEQSDVSTVTTEEADEFCKPRYSVD